MTTSEKPKTLQDEWRRYRDACYPTGIEGIQNRECHQAFFAGALVALQLMDALSALPEDQAVRTMQALGTEAMEMCKARQTLNNWRS